MFDFSVSKDTKKMDVIRGVTVGEVAACLCLTLIVKELRINQTDKFNSCSFINFKFLVFFLQGMTKDVGFSVSVGGTTQMVYNYIK